ncbi:MAG: homogentisate phytyltransferase / homogentisate geranylgeranyltransferase [Solirubrobacteraceae bacterium]|jgi:homogentisate phytyltransferase/homogentisate geranylgeranyltransferase|nr:homogentisate phytyltransferase / homogentisate geranylgeranyltransferase [Solirubrobacteraceae bacterium]
MSSTALAAPLRRTRVAAGVLWRFSRPHTAIGTALSVLGIFAIAAHDLGPLPAGRAAFHLFWTLVAALAVNVFIVGINQLSDVEIDRINKPRLPLAAGELSMRSGRAVVAAAAILPVVLAISQGWIELAAVLAALAIGWAYSCEPLRLKRYPAAAAASISLVRSLVVNLGVYLHFAGAFGGGTSVTGAVWALTLFVLPFSLAIAVLKDVPDAEGDSAFDVRTFTVRLGQRTALLLGMAALTVAYAGMAVLGPLLLDGVQPAVLIGAHAAALALVWWWALRVDPGDRDDFTAFYMRVWGLFFCEYLVVPAAVLLG